MQTFYTISNERLQSFLIAVETVKPQIIIECVGLKSNDYLLQFTSLSHQTVFQEVFLENIKIREHLDNIYKLSA